MRLVMVGVTAPSHIYPGLGVIRELMSRGHEVVYVVGDRHADLVPTPVGYTSALPGADGAWPEDPGAAMHMFLDEEITALPVVRELERPDAVLYDIGGYAGRVAAHHWGVPAIQLSPTFVAWEGYESDMAEFTAALKGSESGARFFAAMRSWLDENGMSIDADSFLGRPERCVVLIPRVLQPNADRVGPQFVFTGPCVDETRMTGWTPAGDGPLAYVAFGTAYTDNLGIYRACVEALSEYELVIATGKIDPEVLGVGGRTQPQLDVLAHADVFITHAGMGSASESLWFGVPTVAIPQAVDQFTNAAQLEAAGAGVHVPSEDVTVERVRAAVAAAREKAPRVRELQEEVRRDCGIAASADAIERLVGA